MSPADEAGAVEVAELVEGLPDDELEVEARPKLKERISRKVGGWMVRRLQKRVEREWRKYDHSPKVSLGPWSRRRSANGGTQVYRSLVQIHFHPRERHLEE